MESQEARQVDEIILKERSEAEEVLARLKKEIRFYKGYVTIEDYYELCDLSGIYMDAKWGWNNLDEVTISEVEDGFKLNLPQTQQTYKFYER